MKRLLALSYTFILSVLIASLSFGGELRKLGQGDIEWGTGTKTSPGGATVTKLPRYFSSDAFTDNLYLYGKGFYGDNTGRIQDITFGSAAGTDNGVFGDVITKGPWVDVRAYGASTTASAAVNRAAIQTAADNAVALTRPLYIPELYEIDNTILITGDIAWIFCSHDYAGLFNTGAGVPALKLSHATTIQNCYIKGNNVASPGFDNASHGIEVTATVESQMRLLNVKSDFHKGHGFYSSGAIYGTHIEAGEYNNNSGDGINFKVGSQNGNATTLKGNSIGTNRNGVAWGGAAGLSVEGGSIENNTEYGVKLTKSGQAVKISTYFEGNTLGAIRGEPSGGSAFTGFDIKNTYISAGAVPAISFSSDNGSVHQFTLDRSNYITTTSSNILNGGNLLGKTCFIDMQEDGSLGTYINLGAAEVRGNNRVKTLPVASAVSTNILTVSQDPTWGVAFDNGSVTGTTKAHFLIDLPTQSYISSIASRILGNNSTYTVDYALLRKAVSSSSYTVVDNVTYAAQTGNLTVSWAPAHRMVDANVYYLRVTFTDTSATGASPYVYLGDSSVGW